MTVTALWLQNPSSVLLLAKGDDHPLIPYVRRVSRADYWGAVGWQSGYNRSMRSGSVAPIDHMRLDVNCRRILDISYTGRGVRYGIASPLLAIGLLWTKGGSDWVERDMRAIFTDPDDARQAAAIAVRSFEHYSRAQGRNCDR